MDRIKLFHDKMENITPKISDQSVDVICIDPPYLYLKKQKLEVPFDEPNFFQECKRILTKDGFVVMFGRGASFYRWNTILANLGFTFKEEIVWNKSQCTSPLMNLSRVHETISIFTKGKGTINKCKVPYLEMKGHDIDSICDDIKRMRSILKNTKALNAVLHFLENNTRDTSDSWDANQLSISSVITKEDRCVSGMRSVTEGLNEKSIINYTSDRKHKNSTSVQLSKLTNIDRSAAVMSSMQEGLNEKSIIKQVRDHYSAIHPTQKPVRLLERLLALVIPKNKPTSEVVVADFFGGSFSTMEAVYNMGMQGISCEMDEEYYDLGKQRIEHILKKQKTA